MDLDYIDLVIIHSPEPWSEFRGKQSYDNENLEVWRALEDAYALGKVKAIGVSNFLIEDLNNILDHCKIKPMVNQIITHISNTDMHLINFCKSKSIQVVAYSPIAHGKILNNLKIKEIANKYHVSIPQICIKYVLQLGLVALPKATSIEHLKNNIDLDFTISDDDMKILLKIDKIENYGEYSHFPVFNGKKKER